MVRCVRRLAGHAALMALLAYSASAAAGDYILNLGASVIQPQLTVKGSNGTGSSMGKLTSGNSLFPSIGISTPNRYFDDSSHWGYYYFGDLSYAKIDRQTQTGPPAANGQPAYLPGSFAPIYARQADAGVAIFLSFGDTLVKNPSQGTQFKVGFGVGLSYAALKGTVPGQYMQTGQPENIHATGFGASANVIYRLTIDGWFLEANMYVASRTQQFRNYSISDSSLTLGYGFPFSI